MKKITFTLILFLAALAVKSQTTYITSDDEALVGIILKSGTDKQNAEYITRIKAGKEVKLSPDDISTYGLNDGRKYIAKESKYIDKGKVFLELLVEGDFNLYYYAGNESKQYFYSNPDDDKLLPLTKGSLNNLKEDLNNKSDCDQINNAFKLLKLNHNSLIRFFRGLKDCDFFPYHRLKYGANIGLSQVTFLNNNVTNRYLSSGKYDYSNSLSFGLFVEIPIDLTLTKIVTGVNYYSHQLSNEYTNLAGPVKTEIDFAAINIPLIFKFNIKDDNMTRPFFQLGLTYDNLFRNNNSIEAEPRVIENENGNVVQEVGEEANANYVSNQYYGILIGIGTEFNLNHRSEIKTEINYSIKTGNVNTLDMSTFNYSISYVF